MYTENIIFPCISWERSSLTSCPRKEYHVFGKEIPSLQIIEQWSCPGVALFEKTIFSESLKKISYLRVFFWKRSSFIFHLRGKIIFSGKRRMIFPEIIQERSYSSAIFLERPSFQNVWKNKIWFSVQWRENYPKRAQNNLKQPKRRPKPTQNDAKRYKTTQNNPKRDVKWTKAYQNDPKRNKVFEFSRNKLSRIAELEA